MIYFKRKKYYGWFLDGGKGDEELYQQIHVPV